MPNIQVDKMADEADDLHRKYYPEQYGDPPLPADPDPNAPPATPDTPAATVPPVEPPLSAEPATPAPDGTPTEPVTPAPATPPGEEPPVAPQAPDPFESRYNVLKGKYDAEVPRLAAEIAALKSQVARQQAPPVPAPPPAPTALAKTLTIAEITSGDPELKEALDDFSSNYPEVGDLLVKLTERAALLTGQRVNDAVNAVNAQVQSVQEYQAVSRTQAFWDIVNNDLPQWVTIRDNPDFATWLSEVEPFAGVPRGALLQDALQKMDAHRVLQFYKGFAAKSPATTPSETTPNHPTPTPVPGAALVAPPSGTRAAPTPTPPNNEPPITKAYIQKFYTEAARGEYVGRDKEFNTIEARINNAVHKGEVTG